MPRIPISSITAALTLSIAVLAGACGPAARTATAPQPDPSTLERAARADSVRESYSQADVDFMTGMIHHHAQALVMSRMAPTHGASPPLEILAARIINGQKDEIALMQRWLRERGEPVPEVRDDGTVVGGAGHAGHGGHGGHGGHDAHGAHGGGSMPGMLTAEQMARLDAARGDEWDELFLTYMIRHHQGALTMVDELFATPGAAQGDEMFKIASDIGADQASEIDRMRTMLREIVLGPGRRL